MLRELKERFEYHYAKIKVYMTDKFNKVNPNGEDILNYEDLAPKDDIDTDKHYCRTLLWAFKNRKVRNVALTGPYGSGKSSILQTFQKLHKQYRYLNISLATFQLEEEPEGDISETLEKSVLQQMFYQVKDTTIPYSRYTKISHLDPFRIIFGISIFLIMVSAGAAILNPRLFLNVKDNANALKSNFSITDTWIYIIAALFFILLYKFVYESIKYIKKNMRISKVNLQKAEIEFDKDSKDSVFNRYLDEILYFFEVTDYDVVTFEDMDRFENVNLFTKLRELNSILNNSKQINRKIVFIYAIKDEMFQEKERTKFFDFIIPVIPVINSSNSGAMMVSRLEKMGCAESISSLFVYDVASYIDDMRTLINICNEFILYRKILSNIKLDPEQLLGMIVYKNAYPDDFAKLQYNEGMVYDVIQTKELLIKEKLEKTIVEIQELENEIRIIEKEHLDSFDELQAAYRDALVSQLGDNVSFYFGHIEKNIMSIKFQEIINHATENKNYQYRDRYGNRTPITFEALDTIYGTKEKYTERVRLLQLRDDDVARHLDRLKSKLGELKEYKGDIEGLPLKDLIDKTNLEKAFRENTIKKRLLVYLVRNGFIDERYHSFISHFYTGILTREDMDFVMSVKDQISLPYDYTLTNVNAVIERLYKKEFKNEEILNYSMLEFILDNWGKYQDQANSIFAQLSSESNRAFEFIEGFRKQTKNKHSFIKELCKRWPNIWTYIRTSPLTQADKNIYLADILMHADSDDLQKIHSACRLSEDISVGTNFLHYVQGGNYREKVLNELKVLSVKFENFTDSEEFSDVKNYIYRHSLYQINPPMVKLLISSYSSNDYSEINEANYTTIMRSGCDNLIQYINSNINEYVEKVLVAIKGNTKESEETVIRLLNNSEILYESKVLMLQKEETIIQTITDVNSDCWEILISTDKLKINWNNLYIYFKKFGLDETIKAALNAHSASLGENSIKDINLKDGEEAVLEEFVDKLIRTAGIHDDSFSHIVRSFPGSYNSYDVSNLSLKRVRDLIESKFLALSPDNFDNLKANKPDAHIELLENNYESFVKAHGNYNLDAYDITLLLGSPNINDDQKMNILGWVNPTLIPSESPSINVVYELLMKYPDTIRPELLRNILKADRRISEKVLILAKQVKILTKEEITEFLIVIGDELLDLPKTGRRLQITNTPFYRSLIEELKKSDYISSWSIDNKKLRVNTKLK